MELKGLTGNSQESRRFSFCDPHVVSNVKKAEVSTGAKPVPNSLTQMPDLTSGPAFAAKLQEKNSYQAASTLKVGSVLDILGGMQIRLLAEVFYFLFKVLITSQMIS